MAKQAPGACSFRVDGGFTEITGLELARVLAHSFSACHHADDWDREDWLRPERRVQDRRARLCFLVTVICR